MVDQLMQEEVEAFTLYVHATSAVLVLAHCFLEPVTPRHLDSQQQQQPLRLPLSPPPPQQQQQRLVVPNAGPFHLTTGVAIGESPMGLQVHAGMMFVNREFC
jgi:hypothetical protein